MRQLQRPGIGMFAMLLLLGIRGGSVMAQDSPVRVHPTSYANMYELYQQNKSHGTATLVTSDSVLHTAHVLFDYTLRAAELQRFAANLTTLTECLSDAATTQAQQWAAQQRNVDRAVALPPLGYERVAAYCWVARKLLDPAANIPESVRPLAEPELKLILAHDAMTISPIMGVMEDYTQYIPRGHYTRNEEFKRYFLAMMWYGRAGFPISGEKSSAVPLSPAEARANALTGIVLARLLNTVTVGKTPAEQTMHAQDLWTAIYQPTEFIVGQSDDLTPPEYLTLSNRVFGATLPADWGANTIAKTDQFIATACKLRQPKILGTPQSDLEKKPPVALRLMGQRFIPDSAMLQHLVHPLVQNRFMPTGLDIMAVLGSRQAEALLRKRGEFTTYPDYDRQLTALREGLQKMSPAEWRATAYACWLGALRTLVADPALTGGQGELHGLPEWWSSEAWQDKQLNAALGSWAELRHDTILYAKQSYTLTATAIYHRPTEQAVYVEPVPEVYQHIAALMEALQQQLEACGVFPAEMKTNYASFAELLQALTIISQSEVTQTKQLRTPRPPTQDEWASVRNIGAILRQVETLPGDLRTLITGNEDTRMALIADVHTDPNRAQVLEVGVGNVASVTVPVTVEEQTIDVTGPIFTYYEFLQPMDQRLTDGQWQQMLPQQPTPLILPLTTP